MTHDRRPSVRYDKARDVLYLRFGPSVDCRSEPDDDIEGLVFRYSLADDKLNGVTVVWYSKQDKSALSRKIPCPVHLP